MKSYILVFMLFSLPFISTSQSSGCNDLIIVNTKGNGATSLTPVVIPGAEIRVLNIEHSYMLISISLPEGDRCFEKGKPIEIEFTDDTKIELPNDNDASCSKEGLLNLGGQHKHDAELQALRTKLVRSIRISSNGGMIGSTLTDENQSRLREIVGCISQNL